MRSVLSRPADGKVVEEGDFLIVPSGPADLAAHYDLTVSHRAPGQPQFVVFDRWLAQEAAGHGLSCALLHDGVVREAARRLAQGRLTIGFHVDLYALWHLPEDPYARLSCAIQDAGGRPVNAPPRARAFTDKAAAHAELLRQGLGVPATLVVRPWIAERPLSDAERERLRLDEPGAAVYVKPANGFGGGGVVRTDRLDPDALAAALAQARQYDPQDAYLLQREVGTPWLDGEDGVRRPACWRVFHCLGEQTAFWWQPADRLGHGQASYRRVTAAEMRHHRLWPLLDYAGALADLTGLDWFSTELCLSEGPEVSCFSVPGPDGRDRPVLAIDYVNEPCDVEVQSRWAGALPDEAVRRMAERFAEAAWRARQAALRPGPVVYQRVA